MKPSLILSAVAAVLLTACASYSGRGISASTALPFEDNQTTAASGHQAAHTSGIKAVDPDYRLAPRDQIVFEMFNEPDMRTTQRLSSRGEMTLPLIGAVTLAGMTLREAEQEIRGRYVGGGYYVEPHVILSVAEYGAHYITVLGQVNKPDRIELPIEAPSLGVVEAITQAGGFTRLARTDAVQITRQTAHGTERHITIDVRSFLGRNRDGNTDEFQLEPGDVVFVPERLF